jgi:hypothetical protein
VPQGQLRSSDDGGLDAGTRARLRAKWMRTVRDMEPAEQLVLVEALRLCAESDRHDVEFAADLIASDVRACIDALDGIKDPYRQLDEQVDADVRKACRVVLALQHSLRRHMPEAA